MTAPRLARTITVVQRKGGGKPNEYSLAIDGEEFPWLVAEGSIRTTVSGDRLPSLTITILAESLALSNDWTSPPKGTDTP